MDDKDKTNKELLDEVKKLRDSTEKENATKDSIRKWESWGFILAIITVAIFLFWACSK